MKGPDPNLSRWARERREERQETNSHDLYGRSDPSGEPLSGWNGIAFRSSDNTNGERVLELDLRPVLLGLVEVHTRLSTQPVSSEKQHSKKAYLYTTPTALRDLARQLLDTADAADALKVKPRPVG